jgi:hypothetical protein
MRRDAKMPTMRQSSGPSTEISGVTDDVQNAIREVLEEQFDDYESYMAYIERLKTEERADKSFKVLAPGTRLD